MSYLRFTSSHEWIDTEQDPMNVGITNHAQSLLGDMVYIELPPIGTEVAMGDEIGVLESVKAASEIYAPISGVIVATNSDVVENPALLNSDPCGSWLVKIKPNVPEKAFEEISRLSKETEYLEDIAEEQ